MKEKIGRLAELLERSGIDADDVGRVEKINVWQGFYKDENGEAQTVDMAGIVLSPEWASGPQWPVVQPAAPTTVRPVKSTGAKTDAITTVVLPDPQIGYRRVRDDLVPMHDEAAMDVALQIVRDIKPQRVVNLGDFIDLPEWSSKFLVLPEFVLTTQPSLDRAHLFLAQQRAVVGDDAEIVLLAGNHDDRLGKAIAKNAMAAMRLRRASAPEEFPVLSIPFLLRLEDLKVAYVGGYPAGRFKITQGNGRLTPLYAIHGERLDVAKVAREERQSFVQGHIHRIAMHSYTFEIADHAETVIAFSPGCLCRVDGAVPSTRSGTDEHGLPLRRFEAWQQGLAVIQEDADGLWSSEIITIYEGSAVFRGKRYKSNV